MRRPPSSTLFPYTTLFRSAARPRKCSAASRPRCAPAMAPSAPARASAFSIPSAAPPRSGDRKSTRLNSSHSQISYAVFCLKKTNPDGEFEALVYDIDFWPADRRAKLLHQLAPLPLGCPVAVHSYNLDDEQIDYLQPTAIVV